MTHTNDASATDTFCQAQIICSSHACSMHCRRFCMLFIYVNVQFFLVDNVFLQFATGTWMTCQDCSRPALAPDPAQVSQYYWSGDSSEVEQETHDWKVSGSRSGRRIFFSRISFLCWLLFLVSVSPQCYCNSMLKKIQVTAKNAGGRLQLNMHAAYVCDFK